MTLLEHPKIEMLHISALTPNPRNARKHPATQIFDGDMSNDQRLRRLYVSHFQQGIEVEHCRYPARTVTLSARFDSGRRP